jgi:hypothetical protein
MAFGFLGRRRRGGHRQGHGGSFRPGQPPHERDESAQARPVAPREKLKQASRDLEGGRRDTEARWASGSHPPDAERPAGKRPPPSVIRRRSRI